MILLLACQITSIFFKRICVFQAAFSAILFQRNQRRYRALAKKKAQLSKAPLAISKICTCQTRISLLALELENNTTFQNLRGKLSFYFMRSHPLSWYHNCYQLKLLVSNLLVTLGFLLQKILSLITSLTSSYLRKTFLLLDVSSTTQRVLLCYSAEK